MRRLWLIAATVLAFGCPAKKPGTEAQPTSTVDTRATRRAFDGAPPVIPHDNLGATCTECHSKQGVRVEGLGHAPPSPHGDTQGLGDRARCRQCHVFQKTKDVFRDTTFTPLVQNLRKGTRQYAGAPPVIPHDVLMRENCEACHAGPAARAPIRTSHPERTNCRQCHATRSRGATAFVRP